MKTQRLKLISQIIKRVAKPFFFLDSVGDSMTIIHRWRWGLVLCTCSFTFVSPPRHRWTTFKALQKMAWRAQCASSCPCVSFIIASAPLSERHRTRVSTQTVLVEIAERRDERGHYGPHGYKHKRCSSQQWPLVSAPCDTLHPIQKSPLFFH